MWFYRIPDVLVYFSMMFSMLMMLLILVFWMKSTVVATNLCQVKGGSYFGVPGRMNLPESWILLEAPTLPKRCNNICNAQEAAFHGPSVCQVSSIILQGSLRC